MIFICDLERKRCINAGQNERKKRDYVEAKTPEEAKVRVVQFPRNRAFICTSVRRA